MEWISVKDRLPKSGEDVLVVLMPTEESKKRYDYDDESWPRVRGEICYYQDEGWVCINREVYADEHYHTAIMDKAEVTHWMPYPQAGK